MILIATNEAARTAGVKAGALVRLAAGILGGGGGGKDDVAQGGGTDAAKVGAALAPSWTPSPGDNGNPRD